MKKSCAQFKADSQPSKLIESLRLTYKTKDLIQKASDIENSNRGLSEIKFTNKIKATK